MTSFLHDLTQAITQKIAKKLCQPLDAPLADQYFYQGQDGRMYPGFRHPDTANKILPANNISLAGMHTCDSIRKDAPSGYSGLGPTYLAIGSLVLFGRDSFNIFQVADILESRVTCDSATGEFALVEIVKDKHRIMTRFFPDHTESMITGQLDIELVEFKYQITAKNCVCG